jgi:hypothetical protein
MKKAVGYPFEVRYIFFAAVFLGIIFNLYPEDADAVNAADSAPDICAIEEEAYEELREPYAQRPRPGALVFNEREVGKYIDSLPADLRESERKRYDIIKGAKEHIIKLFERNTVDLKDSVRLRSGKTISGTIALANDKVFIVRKGKSGKGKTYKWEDLPFKGYVDILEDFAARRMKISGGSVSREESQKYAANDYILLTLLCDWYAEYKMSSEFARKAVSIRPDIKDQLNDLVFK